MLFEEANTILKVRTRKRCFRREPRVIPRNLFRYLPIASRGRQEAGLLFADCPGALIVKFYTEAMTSAYEGVGVQPLRWTVEAGTSDPAAKAGVRRGLSMLRLRRRGV